MDEMTKDGAAAAAGDAGEADRPDVQALLAEVDAAVAAKKARGLYDEAEIRRVEQAAASLRSVPDGPLADMALRHSWLAENWDAKPPEIKSHRGGLAGRLVVGAKLLVHRLTRPYINIVLARQSAFNDQLVRLLNVLVPQHADLLHRQEHSERQAVEAEDLAREHGRLIRELERASGARLTALERHLLSGQVQTEELLARLQRLVEGQAAAGQAAPEAAREVARVRAASRGASYLAFEDLHRGTREEIKDRQRVYLPIVRPAAGAATPVLDLGCGRGEFLELCREAGIAARGVDLNPEMVRACRGLGLEVEEGNAREFLSAQPDGAFGAILLSQVIEHLGADELTELVALAARKLAPGGALVAETVNPQSLSTFAGAFYVDLTHVKPIHPEAARFLWRWAGLGEVQVLYLSPVAPEHQLEKLPEGPDAPEWTGAFNRNVIRLNQIIWGPLDYAVVGRR